VSHEATGPLAPGASLRDGRYRLERLLGAGGMATVWLAHDETLARPVAVKLMADTLATDPNWVRRFEREARAAASLNHPNVVPVFDYGTERGRPFLVMQYIPGGTLEARSSTGAVAGDAETLARELLDAIAHIHDAGLVHRDIKPANVLLDEDGRPRITDFGIARPRDATSLTRPGNVLGTAPYLAPEVMAGKPATARSDLFSCGKLLGQAAGAQRSARLERLMRALIADDPEQRPASARAALALFDGLSAESTAPAAAAPFERAGRVGEAETVPLAAAAPARALPGTRPTAPRPRRSRDPLVRRRSRAIGRLPAAAAGVAVLIALAAVVAIVLASGGGAPQTPAQARPRAALQQQLGALERRVSYATHH
jgi:eukaryotic-like serine/threonine-protein kinase